MIHINGCTLAVDREPLGPQHHRHPPRTEKRPGGERRGDPPHQRQIAVVVRRGRAVHARAREPEQAALPADRQRRVVAVEHRFAVRSADRPDLRAKKGFSTVSCPIFRSRASSASMPAPGSRARSPAAAFSRHRSGWGEPRGAPPSPPPSPCSRSASKAILAFSAASIFRLGLLIIVSVYHDGDDPAQAASPIPCLARPAVVLNFEATIASAVAWVLVAHIRRHSQGLEVPTLISVIALTRNVRVRL
jgi:hypothetical protein